MNLTRKGYARIYVSSPEDIPKVSAIIKELDEFEHGYLPNKLIAPFSEFPALCYTHKFDGLCMNRLTAECWKRGVFIWVCDNGHQEYMNEKSRGILDNMHIANGFWRLLACSR